MAQSVAGVQPAFVGYLQDQKQTGYVPGPRFSVPILNPILRTNNWLTCCAFEVRLNFLLLLGLLLLVLMFYYYD